MRGGELTLHRNVLGEKNQKKARTVRRNAWCCRPCSAIPRSCTLKRGGVKMVTHLTIACSPLSIKDDTH
jgi:hypothetical protein